MEFLIADTFTDSLARLTGEEQKAVKTTAFDLQLNPAQPGMNFHKLDKAKDKKFWSVRVSGDLRLIVHRTGTSLLLCYVSHHDEAYQWAERRKLETHPKTGAAQLVEIRERIQEITIPKYVESGPTVSAKPLLFANLPDSELLGYGVPSEWLPDVRSANEETLLELTDHLPKEAAEALLDLATGATPQTVRLIPPRLEVRASPKAREIAQPRSIPPQLRPAVVSAGSFEHPDARRRFRLINNLEELERALDYPWEKWTVFLHPTQRELVEREFNGPARVSGSAGTGKTIVALHRVAYLARTNPDSRLLLTTFSDPLSNALRTKLRHLIGNEPRLGERIEVHAMNSIGKRLYEANLGKPQFASTERIRELVEQAARGTSESRFSLQFLMAEWEQVVDAWQLETWEAYRDVTRLGRKTRLKEPQRAIIWSIFEQVRSNLKAQELITRSEMFSRLASFYAGNVSVPFDFMVVDEAQDVSIAQLRFLAALGRDQGNSLFFAGDLGQRIFQQPFSWKALGVDIRGRSTTLGINYRTSHQIRMQADRLLGPELADVDGTVEKRKATSLFNGPPPTIQTLDSIEQETKTVSEWLEARTKEGLLPHEIAIFVRSAAELDRAQAAVERAGLPFKVLDDTVETAQGKVSIATMHLAKGLEFRAVAVMACDDEVIPQQKRIETVADDSDLEEVYNTERHLLYVACTRARDHLLVTSVSPASEFLDDLRT
ncbi:MAG: UvrD-helicase domain-containing protein [Acidobacteriia bacterium]|nr:UvrD-helicase domain-containing protein [Terriglobia bacterium]